MDVHFVPPDLRRLDKLRTQALTAAFFEDERPLRGVLGLVDWRLCGVLSRLIIRGRIGGRQGETLLLPPRPRLPFEKLFVFGLGPRAQFAETAFDECAERILDTLGRAQVRASVLSLPGRSVERIEAGAAMERFLEIAARYPEYDEVTLVEEPEGQKAIEPVVERVRRRARAPLDPSDLPTA